MNHAYGILALKECSNFDLKLLKIYNPWGEKNSTWYGLFSQYAEDEKWAPFKELRAELELETAAGEFWIKFEDWH